MRRLNFRMVTINLFCATLISGCSFVNGRTLLGGELLVVAPERPVSGRALTVTFLGVSTLLFSDGENSLLIDGFFSRPSIDNLLFHRKVLPDTIRIRNTLKKYNIAKVDAILVSHSHYDHAMDAGVVASITDSLVLGSPSTLNIVRGTSAAFPEYAVPESRLFAVVDGQPCQFGSFTVTFVKSKHFDLQFNRRKLIGTTIDRPLKLPARINQYGEGTTWSIHIAHPQGDSIVHPSAGFLSGALEHVNADVVFLGISRPGRTDPESLTRYWNEVVVSTGAERVFPVHWDNPTRPLTEELQTLPLWFDNVTATIRTLKFHAEKHGTRIQLLPLGRAVPIQALADP